MIDNSDRSVDQVIWDGPAFEAGFTNSDLIVALDGESFDSARLAERIANAAQIRKPLEFIVRRGDQYRTVSIPYYGGNRYPRLQKIGDRPGWLDVLLTPKP